MDIDQLRLTDDVNHSWFLTIQSAVIDIFSVNWIIANLKMVMTTFMTVVTPA